MKRVAVIGAGPAGWAAAGELRQRGIEVSLVAPNPEGPFRNGYGVWLDELSELGLGDIYERSWPAVRVHFNEAQTRRLERRYARVDNGKLLAALRDRAQGVTTYSASVEAVDEREDSFRLRGPGLELNADLVIDASGHESKLLTQGPGAEPGWQVALGWRLHAPGHPYRVDEAVLMDFRRADPDDPTTADWPSFLYVLPESPEVVFVEETSLVGRPPANIEVLEARMKRRLARHGLRDWKVLDVERCYIPMGGRPPPPVQPVVGFGGAARMVHPATGYTLAPTLRTAPRLAEAADRALRNGARGAVRDRAVWEGVWTRGERAAHDLQRFGMEVLLDMNTEATSEFFETFFRLPRDHWEAYMSGRAGPEAVRAAMWGVFARASWGLRFRLAKAGLAPKGAPLRRAVFVLG